MTNQVGIPVTTRKPITQEHAQAMDVQTLSYQPVSTLETLGATKYASSISDLSDATLQEIVMVQVAYYWNKLEDAFGGVDLSMEEINFRFDMRGLKLGQACLGERWVRFNMQYIRMNLQKYLTETVPHELAHLFASKIQPRAGHGHVWKMVMRRIGCAPNTCANLTSEERAQIKPARKVSRWHYSLPCGCELDLTKKYHQISQGLGYKGRGRYYYTENARVSCRRHGTKIQPEHWVK